MVLSCSWREGVALGDGILHFQVGYVGLLRAAVAVDVNGFRVLWSTHRERFRDGDGEESLSIEKALCECPRGQRLHLTHLGVSPSLLFARTWSFRGK